MIGNKDEIITYLQDKKEDDIVVATIYPLWAYFCYNNLVLWKYGKI